MIRKMIYLAVALSVLLLLFGCGGEKKAEKKELEPEVKYYHFPLPSFSDVFEKLDYLEGSEYDKLLPDELPEIKDNVFKAAFSLGALTADAIFAAQSRNKTKLIDIAAQMIDYSKFIGLSEDILKLADELKMLIEADKWKELEVTLDKYKQDIVFTLYNSGDFDTFILLQLGGWTEGLDRLAKLLIDNYNAENTDIINEVGVLSNLIYNVDNIENEQIASLDYYQLSSENLKKIRTIFKSISKREFTKEELETVFKLTQEIKKSFS